jgi:hypothetical protein
MSGRSPAHAPIISLQGFFHDDPNNTPWKPLPEHDLKQSPCYPIIIDVRNYYTITKYHRSISLATVGPTVHSNAILVSVIVVAAAPAGVVVVVEVVGGVAVVSGVKSCAKNLYLITGLSGLFAYET